MLKIYNSISNKKEEFKPQDESKVSIYVCGMTVYDLCHLGHARTVTAFDITVRFLRYSGYNVTYVRNITDIDDKIIRRAQENNITCSELTTKMIQEMNADFDALNNTKPDFQPKATEYINSMIAMIQQLIDIDYAYPANNGDVYYRTNKFASYGKLSGKITDDLVAGHRIDIDLNKNDPKDFVLWKSAKADEPSWNSPWSNGRPGWHIECSAMAKQLLGSTIDIHCGGVDLKFPHHENEIAQSEACNKCTFANYWMHTGAIKIDNVKMSKSLGNFFTIRDILEKYNAESIRFFLISSHYRSPINYSIDAIEQAQLKLTKLYTALQGLEINQDNSRKSTKYDADFIAAMNDDFNTAEAIAVLFELVKNINIQKKNNLTRANELAGILKKLGNNLGILQQDADNFLQYAKPRSNSIDEAWIIDQIKQRNKAKKDKNFALADKIRESLDNQGILLQDSRAGTTWRQK